MRLRSETICSTTALGCKGRQGTRRERDTDRRGEGQREQGREGWWEKRREGGKGEEGKMVGRAHARCNMEV